MPFMVNHKNTHSHHRKALLDALQSVEKERAFAPLRVVLGTKNIIRSSATLILRGYPSIICIVGFGRVFTDYGILGRLIFWLLIKLLDFRSALGFITENDEDYEWLSSVTKSPVYFTHGSGLDPSRFFKKVKVKSVRPKIGYLSRFGDSKCSDQVLRAARDLPKDRELVLAGWEITGSKYTDEFKKLALKRDNITFLGRLSGPTEVSNFFNDIDIFITPSLREGGNISLQEAIWHSVPFATTSVAGCRILAKKFDGLHCDPNIFSDLILSEKILTHKPNLKEWPSKLKPYLINSVTKEYYLIFMKIVDNLNKR